MASGNRGDVVEGIPIIDSDGQRRTFLNIANGKIEDMPASQKMVFDTQSGKLMVVVSENKSIKLDSRVFSEFDKDGFFVCDFMGRILNCHDRTCFTTTPEDDMM
ncbi:Hypothetical predicted protein [Paramuricea clavata]|uniref:Uncharacterized protein n=1 Tax=Paramuricea clavata TaxID=317549 RepID=A0A6S7I2J3_PARCT|nr:Hypothetical predicted protein [Paramuricea clavata]